jgi:hypothetical protein
MKEGNLAIVRKIIIFTLSIIIAIGFLELPITQTIINTLANIKYIGIFIAGIFFTYSTTTFPALAIFIRASELMNPYLLIPLGAFGAMLGDLFILTYVEKLAGKDIKKALSWIRKRGWLDKLKHATPLFMFAVFASPLPDELAAAISEAPKYDWKTYALIAFISKIIGISIIFWMVNII